MSTVFKSRGNVYLNTIVPTVFKSRGNVYLNTIVSAVFKSRGNVCLYKRKCVLIQEEMCAYTRGNVCL